MEDITQNTIQDSEFTLLDLRRFVNSLLRNLWKIAVVTLLSGVLALVGSLMFITPMYQASATFYVNNSVSLGDASLSISSGDISTSKSLVSSYLVILRTRGTLLEVIDYAESDRTYSELLSMISASGINNTEFFRINVVSEDPKEAEHLANAISYVIPRRISMIIEGSSAKVVDYAITPSTPYNANYSKNTAIGFLLGAIISIATIILIDILNVTIKDEDDVQNCCHYPVLALVPDMSVSSRRGYYRGYYRKHSHYASDKKKEESSNSFSNITGKKVSFTASEAYNLLRTKLLYSFADEQACHVYAVSSALAGEGKSISSINLSYSLAQMNKKVLLIDCDMRRPTLAKKMGLNKYPGLSEYLTGFLGLDELFQEYKGGDEDDAAVYVMTAGISPPNPVELINSEKMSKMIATLRNQFDYIIMDMPPICDVSDALVSAKIADGVLLIVRQHYSSRVAVKDAIKQFEFVNAKILGTVLNCVSDKVGTYKRKKYGYKYRYGYRFGYGYRYQSHYNYQQNSMYSDDQPGNDTN